MVSKFGMQLTYALRVAFIGLAVAAITAVHPAVAQQKVVSNQTSNAGPALAVFNGQVFMAWAGTDSNNTLNVAAASDGLHFGTPVTVGTNWSHASPTLAAFNGKLYLAWQGARNSIAIASSTDGLHFGSPSVVSNYASEGSVALTSCNGQLFLEWADLGTHYVTVANSSDGVNFPSIDQLTNYVGDTPFSPSIACFGTTVFNAYARAPLAEDPINRAMIGPVVQSPLLVLGSSAPGLNSSLLSGPGLGSVNSELFYSWVGPNASTEINLATYYVNGESVTLANQQTLGQTTTLNPAVVGFNGHLYIAWVGTDGPRHLNIEEVF